MIQFIPIGAMSFGGILVEAHTTLAVATNRIEGKFNTDSMYFYRCNEFWEYIY